MCPLLGNVSVPLLAAFPGAGRFSLIPAACAAPLLIAVVKDLLVYITVLGRRSSSSPSETGRLWQDLPPPCPRHRSCWRAGAGKTAWAAGFCLCHPGLGGRCWRCSSIPIRWTGPIVVFQPQCHPPAMPIVLARLFRGALALIALAGLYGRWRRASKAWPEYAAGFKKLRQQFSRCRRLFLPHVPAFGSAGLAICRHRQSGGLDCRPRSWRSALRQIFFHPHISTRTSSTPIAVPMAEARMAQVHRPFAAKLWRAFFLCTGASDGLRPSSLQLLGGIWICQTVPAVLVGL